jgi:hypothetical protein
MKWRFPKEVILKAVSERDVDFLTLVRERGDADAKAHLDGVMHDGKIKFPQRRPPKNLLDKWSEQADIAFRVWQRGEPKVDRAVSQVAGELRLSERKVWECWTAFQPIEHATMFRELVLGRIFADWRKDDPERYELTSFRSAAADALRGHATSGHDALIAGVLEELGDLDALIGPHNGDRCVFLHGIANWFANNRREHRELSLDQMAMEVLGSIAEWNPQIFAARRSRRWLRWLTAIKRWLTAIK